MTTKKPKKRNPRDLNLINLEAQKKRNEALKLKLKQLKRNKAETMKWILSVEKRLRNLEEAGKACCYINSYYKEQKGRMS